MPIPEGEHKGKVHKTIVLLFQYFHCLLSCGSRPEQVIVFGMNKTLKILSCFLVKLGNKMTEKRQDPLFLYFYGSFYVY